MKVEETIKLIEDGNTKFSNLALAFYKLNIFKLYKPQNIRDIEKKKYLEALKKNFDSDSLKIILKKTRKLYENIGNFYIVKSISARIGYRLVTGMGYPSPVENGFLLHHIYGIPYIPGESVKGLVRFMYIYKKFGLEEDFSDKKLEEVKERVEILEKGKYKKDELNEKDRRFVEIFGTQREGGKVIFFDAYPESFTKEKLSIDVMNNHYGEYYSGKGKKPPADWYNPNPVFFLTLKDVTFIFHIGVEKHTEDGEYLLNEALELLKEGLELFGLGAKRRKGYGWFEVLG